MTPRLAILVMLLGAVLWGCKGGKKTGEPIPCPYLCASPDFCEMQGGVEVFPPADAGR